MPIYEYVAKSAGCPLCRDGIERLQKISDPQLEACPDCGAPMMRGTNEAEFENLSATIRASWLGFTRSGDPNHAGMPQWIPYTSDTPASMRLGPVLEMVPEALKNPQPFRIRTLQ